MSYKIEQIEGIGPVLAQQLHSTGIETTEDLLNQCATQEGRRNLAFRVGLSEGQILKWVNLADLMRIKGIGSQYSELLEAAGVDTVLELRGRNAENLAARMEEVNAQKKLARATPSTKVVEDWISQAAEIPALVSH